MLKSELVQRLIHRLTEKYPQVTEKAVAESTQEIINQIIESLIQNGRLEVRGFGSLSVHHRPAQMVRNPKTGHQVQAPERHKIHFKQAKKLRLRLNASYR